MPVFRTAVMLAALLLAGCGLPLPGIGGGGAAEPVTAAISGEAIETSVLPDAGAEPAAEPPAMRAAPEPPSPVQAEPAATEAAEAPAAAPAVPPMLAEAAAACTRTGGRFASRGAGRQSYACFSTPRDAGKSCSKASDCSSACLARSRTCAPSQPLFGCHEVLTDRGQRVTQCLE